MLDCWTVGLSLFVAGAAFPEIFIDSRSAKCCIFPYEMRRRDGTGKVSEATGAIDDNFIVGIVFILAEAIQRFSAEILTSEFRGSVVGRNT